MLSPNVIAIVKQTAPVLAVHGEALTRHFYRRMFTGDPAVRAFFNPAHQHTGGQQKALAAAVCAYAANIDNLGALGGAVELIAQKHCALGVLPEHYAVVGKHLLGSIKEVLGDAATPAVIDAWAAAYGVLADILIAREAEIYAAHHADHGWRGFREFVVRRKHPESAVITSLHLVPADGGPVRPFRAGQYVTVRAAAPATEPADPVAPATTMRNYSLSGAPGSDHYRISVKRESATVAGAPAGHISNYLHDRVEVGDHIEVGPPCGEFTLDPVTAAADRRPLVLLSAGVGVTPVLSMLHAAVEARLDRDIVFVHAAVNGYTHAFADEVRALAARHPRVTVHNRYSAPTPSDRSHNRFDSEGFVDAALLSELLSGSPADAAFYFCGPKPFMAAVHRALGTLGVKPADIHYEFFGPLQSLQTEPAIASESTAAVVV